MTTTDRLDNVKAMFVEAIDKYKMGLDVEYAFSMGWGPMGPPAPGQMPNFVLAYWCMLMTPNPLLGQQPLGRLICVPDLSIKQKGIDETVLAHMQDLRQMKAEVLNGQEKKRG